MRLLSRYMAMAACGLLLASQALAQDTPERPTRPEGRPGQRGPGGAGGFGGRGGPGGGVSTLQLLNIEKVQKEIALTADQVETIKSSRVKMEESLRDVPREERREKFAGVMNDLQAKVDEVMTSEQKTRLEQISVQVRGIGALNDEKIATKLGITEDQKASMAKLREEQGAKMRADFEARRREGGDGAERRGPPSDADRERFTAARKANEEAVLGVLTATQKDDFEKLKGPKFEIEMRELFQGQGGPGGRGGPGAEGRPEGRRGGPERAPEKQAPEKAPAKEEEAL